jgi:hypothetical protein
MANGYAVSAILGFADALNHAVLSVIAIEQAFRIGIAEERAVLLAVAMQLA